MTPLRAALVGYGLAGRVIHRPLLQADAGWEVTHVVTSSPARREAAAQDLPDAVLVASAEDLWQRADQFDVAVIVTPNDAHAPLARRCLALGKPVVVDKPLARSAAEAAELVAEARRSGVPLSVFHNRRWDSDTLTARELMSAGALGTVHRLESRFTRFRPQVVPRWRERPGGGGLLLDLGTHLVDQAVHLLGPVSSVYAEVRIRRAGAVVDDDDFLALTHVSGASALLWCSAAAPWTGPRLVLQGDAAGWVKQDLDGQEQAQRDGVEVPAEPDGVLWDSDGGRAVPSRAGDWGAYYRSFGHAVRSGAALPVDPEDAVAGLRVLEAAVLSSQRGEVVVLR